MEDHLHAETEMAALGHGLGDTAKTDAAQGFAGDLGRQHVGRAPTGPFPGAQVPFAFASTAGGGQQQVHGDVRRAVGQDFRRVGHHETGLLGRVEVDVVEAYAEIPQDLRADAVDAEHLGGNRVCHGRADRIVLAQGLVQFVHAHRMIVLVEREIVMLEQVRLDRLRPAARGNDFGF